MRTFLTYVLAALAAALAVTVIVSGLYNWDMISGVLEGRYRALAVLNPLLEVGFRAMGYFAAVGLATFVAVRFFGGAQLFGSAIRAPLVGILIVATVAIVTFAVASSFMEVGSFADYLRSISLWGELVLAGAAWGTVFWIRAPKPTTAGIAA